MCRGRDSGNIGQRMVKTELPGRKQRGRRSQRRYRDVARDDADGWCDRGK